MSASLTPAQAEAAYVDAPGGVCVAGPGSGKTTILVERARWLLDRSPQSRVILLTFSRAAAREMRRRLGGGYRDRASVTTLHRFAINLLRRNAPPRAENYAPLFAFRSVSTSESFLVSRIEEASRGDPEVEAALRNHVFCGRRLGDDSRIEVAHARYRDLLRAAAVTDFHEILEDATGLLDDPIVLPSLPIDDSGDPFLREFHVLVDEAQDIDAMQADFIRAIARFCSGAAGFSLFLVGDPRQSIYGWRGSDGTEMMRLGDEWGLRSVPVSDTFRLPPAVARYASDYSREVLGFPEPFVSRREEGAEGGVRVHRVHGVPEHAVEEAVMEAVRHFRESRRPAILFRTRHHLRYAERLLLRAGLPIRVIGGGILDGALSRDLVAWLSVALMGPRAPDDAILLAVRRPSSGFGEKTLRKMGERMGFSADSSLASIIFRGGPAAEYRVFRKENDGMKVPSLTSKFIAMSKRFIGVHESAISVFRGKKSLSINDFLNALSFTFQSSLHEIGFEEESDKISDILRFLFSSVSDTDEEKSKFSLAYDSLSSGPILPLLLWESIMDILVDGPDQDQKNDDGEVILSTIHSAKGLEFDDVIMAHPVLGKSQEECNTFFTGVTRTRGEVGIYVSTMDSSGQPFRESLPVPDPVL